MLIKQVFDELCSHVQADQKLLKAVIEMEAHFVNKRREHIEFFGGNLTGVQPVRFTPDDRDKLFTDILEIDDRELEDKLYRLKDAKGVPVINQEWKVSSDVFNLACAWLIHRFCVSPYLTPAQRREGEIRVCQYMIYRFLTSRLYRHYPYVADPEVAAATYAQLSNKFLLKQMGSWGAVLRYMAEQSTDPNGIHGQIFKTFDSDVGIRNMLNDIQGRPRNMLKNIHGVFKSVKEGGQRIRSGSALAEIDGEIILKDKTRSLANYTRYIKSVAVDANSFIKPEIVDVVAKIMHTMPEKLLVQTLQWASRNYGHTQNQIVENSLEQIAEHAFAYLAEHRELLHRTGDLPQLVAKLKGAYTSSRSSDALLMSMRTNIESMVKAATGKSTDSLLAATRTGFMIYVVVRMLAMRHYTQ